MILQPNLQPSKGHNSQSTASALEQRGHIASLIFGFGYPIRVVHHFSNSNYQHLWAIIGCKNPAKIPWLLNHTVNLHGTKPRVKIEGWMPSREGRLPMDSGSGQGDNGSSNDRGLEENKLKFQTRQLSTAMRGEEKRSDTAGPRSAGDGRHLKLRLQSQTKLEMEEHYWIPGKSNALFQNFDD